MEIQTKGKILTVESKPYSVDGNVGTSHKIRINVDGEIYVCKSNPDQVSSLKQYQGKEGETVIKVNSRAEKLSLELISFEPTA